MGISWDVETKKITPKGCGCIFRQLQICFCETERNPRARSNEESYEFAWAGEPPIAGERASAGEELSDEGECSTRTSAHKYRSSRVEHAGFAADFIQR